MLRSFCASLPTAIPARRRSQRGTLQLYCVFHDTLSGFDPEILQVRWLSILLKLYTLQVGDWLAIRAGISFSYMHKRSLGRRMAIATTTLSVTLVLEEQYPHTVGWVELELYITLVLCQFYPQTVFIFVHMQ